VLVTVACESPGFAGFMFRSISTLLAITIRLRLQIYYISWRLTTSTRSLPPGWEVVDCLPKPKVSNRRKTVVAQAQGNTEEATLADEGESMDIVDVRRDRRVAEVPEGEEDDGHGLMSILVLPWSLLVSSACFRCRLATQTPLLCRAAAWLLGKCECDCVHQSLRCPTSFSKIHQINGGDDYMMIVVEAPESM